MTYLSYADIKPNASRKRLHELNEQLKTLKCDVSFDDDRATLECKFQAGENAWIETGRLTSIFIAFDDVVSWNYHFKKTEKRVSQGALEA